MAGALVAALCVMFVDGNADAQRERRIRGPFLLVTLPSLGTVGWSCDGRWGFALAFRASPRYATTSVTHRAGNARVQRVVHPGDRVEFAFSHVRAQKLSFRQGTGAGTLAAWVVAEFPRNTPTTFCNDYTPPSIRVRVFPRA